MTPYPNDAARVAVTYPAAESLAAIAHMPPATDQRILANRANKALNASATSWFVVTVLGQLIFATYVLSFYGRAAINGQFENWNKVFPRGYVPGETFGNLLVALHLAFAIIIMIGGALQLVPTVRQRAPRFHRWNGRVYLFAVLMQSVGGLTMVWTRGAVGDLSQHLAISINALLILGFAGMALRHAIARRFDVHRRWALRLFLAASGVWFFRVGFMFWLLVNQGPAGFDPETFQGPFLTFLAFGQYLLPLAVLELYFRAQQSTQPRNHIAMAIGLAALTLMMATGVVAATLMMWLPRI